ncbi:hypothetical protein BJ878DRAFT_520292 [Calycina marina]|uniref:Uncharacterized protein n=1 Tax=Calycina marina TaxID=1763456 RepID=A0A9P7YXG6_9HELO|nr:hypothetical protein BJ878DRAFT_520292 [Calycina marina]
MKALTARNQHWLSGTLITRLRLFMVGRFNTKKSLSQRMNGPVPTNVVAYPNGDRRRLVNFITKCRKADPVTGEAFPPTIEFRHARGSLDAAHIMKWVEYCVGLVRLAHKYSLKEKAFRVTDWDCNISTWNLMEDMGLSQESIEYWMALEA